MKEFLPFGLRPSMGFSARRNPPGRYAGFHRRMLAATIDSLLLTPLAPWVDALGQKIYGPPPVNALTLWQETLTRAQGGEALRRFWEELQASGFSSWWNEMMTFQCAVLLGLTGMCWQLWSATPGKLLLGMRIVDASTEAPMSFSQIVMRLTGYFISGLAACLGFFWIGWDKRRQGWHDKLAGTVVILASRPVTPGSKSADPSGSPAPSAKE